MTRLLTFALCLALAVIGELVLENRAVRRDQDSMKYSYGSFLASKVGGVPLASRIKRGSLAVFKSSQGMVACGVLRGGE